MQANRHVSRCSYANYGELCYFNISLLIPDIIYTKAPTLAQFLLFSIIELHLLRVASRGVVIAILGLSQAQDLTFIYAGAYDGVNEGRRIELGNSSLGVIDEERA